MNKVLIVGPLLSISGYGYHSRQIFEYFKSKKNVSVSCLILPWGNTSWFIDRHQEKGLIGEIIDASIHSNKITNKHFDIGLHIQLPSEWRNNYAKFNIGISAYVETNLCNEAWILKTLAMDLVLVPSIFSKNLVINSSTCKNKKAQLQKKIVVVPEYYHQDFDCYENDISSISLKSLDEINTSFNYLTIGHITSVNEECDRKNIIATLRYFCKFFKGNKDVGLILKTSFGRSTTLDKTKTRNFLSNALKEIRAEEDGPKVYFLHGDMSVKDLYLLYNSEKVNYYLSLTKGEGFGLPILEAARCGLPIIATNWSGHLDFLDDDFLKVDYTLKNVPKEKIDASIFVENSCWAVVDEESVLTQLGFSFHNYEEMKFLAKNLKSKIKKKYNKHSINKKYDIVLKEYL
jgi:glycosyltransferase involved in cell wall biosynthesis